METPGNAEFIAHQPAVDAVDGALFDADAFGGISAADAAEQARKALTPTTPEVTPRRRKKQPVATQLPFDAESAADAGVTDQSTGSTDQVTDASDQVTKERRAKLGSEVIKFVPGVYTPEDTSTPPVIAEMSTLGFKKETRPRSALEIAAHNFAQATKRRAASRSGTHPSANTHSRTRRG